MRALLTACAAIAGLCAPALTQAPTSAVVVSFDHTVLQPNESCDGTISVSDGAVVSVEGVLFDQDDKTDGASWTCRAPGTLDDPGDRQVVRQTKRPKAVFARLAVSPASTVTVDSALGKETVRLGDLTMGKPVTIFDGKATIGLAPAAEMLTTSQAEDDYPSIAATGSGDIWVAWQAYDNTNDVIMGRRRASGKWEPAAELSEHRGDYHRPRLVAAGDVLWAVWAENFDGNWELVGRYLKGDAWSSTARLTDRALNDVHHNLTVDRQGRAWIAWQADTGKSHDIMVARLTESGLADVATVTSDEQNDWEPAITPAPGGGVQVAWDTHDRGSYDIHTCRVVGGRVTDRRRLAATGDYEAHASIAFSPDGKLWAAWDNGGPRWGFHERGNAALHSRRSLGLVCLDGGKPREPMTPPQSAIPDALTGHRELPRLSVDGTGRLWLIFRHLVNVRRWNAKTKQPQRQSRGIWSLFAMSYADGEWSAPVLLPHSGGRNDMRAATCVAPDGTLWVAWVGDDRNIIRAEVPGNHNVFAAPLKAGDTAVQLPTQPAPPSAEATPPAQDASPREPVYMTAAGAKYELLYGDTHRHTDMSRCGMNTDGSLQDTYRYAIDVARIDFLGISDHDQDILKHRYDREQRPLQNFMWWRSEKLVDLFHAGPRFTAIYGFEHGGSYKARGGHKNVMYTQRGNPCIEDDAPPDLFKALEGRNAIAIPHQLADGGSATDWEKWDRQWEPVAEMFQTRGSYEYPGGPRMAQVQREGHYLWDALGKGLRVGVIASSDHGLTHGAYAGVYATDRTREAILDAMRTRRTFGATDTIILDLRLGDHMMGEEVEVTDSPTFNVRIIGTAPLRRVDIISDGKFVYTRTREPANPVDEFEVMLDLDEGETSYFYLRCIQENNEMAWSSPIWVTRRAA